MSSKPDVERDTSPAPWRSTDPWATKAQAQAPGAFPSSSIAPQSHVSAPHSLSAAVRARKHEYIRKKTLKMKVGTWNVAAISGTEKDLGAWFVEGYGAKGLNQDLSGVSNEDVGDDDDDSSDSDDDNIESVEAQEARITKKKTTVPIGDTHAEPHGDQIDLYVLGLQEVVDITSMTEAVKPYTDPNPGKKWKKALKRALPPGYKKVAEQQLLGLLLLIYASADLAPSIGSVSTASVGTGLMGYFGNKGAVAARIMLAETTRLCFVNCHLAAGSDQTALNRRIWDTYQILSRTRFSPVSPDGEVVEVGEEKIGDEDFCFWFGDLNYRLDDIPGEDVRRLLLLHTRNEYDVSIKSKRRIDSELGWVDPPSNESLPAPNERYEYSDAERPAYESTAEPPLDPKSDPASLHTTLQSLLAHDQLRAQQRLRRAFHEGWREGEINFLPTYKYDVGSVGMFDSGDKKRSPSWCDRILFRTRRDKQRYEEKKKQLEEARQKDESMKARGIDQATAEHDVLFDYDPETDGLAYGDGYDEYNEEEAAPHEVELVHTQEDTEDTIELLSYHSHQRILSSDHKPLDAVFRLTYDAVIPELKAKVHQEVARELDKAENEGRPSVTVVVDHHHSDPIPNADGAADMNIVDFGEVRYRVRKPRAVTIANTGQITASFAFVDRPTESANDAGVAPRWLKVRLDPSLDHDGTEGQQTTASARSISLSPGETTSVELSINITDGELVYELNEGTLQLDDILVLRIEGGRDHFLPVRGTWMQSSFFRTLDELVVAPEGGVRSLPRSRRNRDSTGTGNVRSTVTHHSAPKELYSLTETLPTYLERSLAEWGMIHDERHEIPPWQYHSNNNHSGLSWPFSRETWTFHEGEERSELLAGVREALDTARPLDSNFDPSVPCLVRLEVLAETLTSFLQSLRDGIISADTWSEVEQRLSVSEKGKVQATSQEIQDMVMDSLSRYPVHSVSLTFVTFLLSRIITEMIPFGGGVGTTAAPSVASFADEHHPSSTVGNSSISSSSRRSRASTLSTDSEHTATSLAGSENSTTTTSLPPVGATKRSLFPSLPSLPLRRRRTGTGTGTGTGSESSTTTDALAPPVEDSLTTTATVDIDSERRKKQLVAAYVDVFAPIVIRSANDTDRHLKPKEKKLLDARKRRVLEAFLETT
ncbi:hypothetical protein ABEF92_000818 [Exophiala dermatitidis]|uniref:Phosphatidylinositol-bisphosphatase n=1 Tax=Exophiala dermatitidis (strain ATCC 34100 / CBS 525.76 / NIH/UT8656) TaxID=858893 RepID=H6BZ38_EXODN|nr:phosphatidylinositol-bisphosphatase [Exophiala dermatitidis NIH/UT8656]EHY56901.1 phosphatidylinositol-bisphosphatase [Exophiala dermatitidis NIH/UT8656]